MAGRALEGFRVLDLTRARRMGGGDKCLRLLAGRSLLAHIIERVAPQVEHLILNANGDPDRFKEYGLDVVNDDIAGFAGPLAGILAAMDWCRAQLRRLKIAFQKWE